MADDTTTTSTTTTTHVPPQQTWPANTPVENMTPEQQVAYWKHQSQKHEGRATSNYALLKQMGVSTAEQAKTLTDRAKRGDDLDNQNATEIEKREREARGTAKAEADAFYRPQLARAAFRAAATGRIEPDKIDGILAPFGDMSYFLTDAGDVDTDKVTDYLNQIAPAKGPEKQQPGTPRGPVVAAHRTGDNNNGNAAPASVKQVMEDRRAARAAKAK